MSFYVSPGFDSIGCYKDTPSPGDGQRGDPGDGGPSSRAIETLEGTDHILDGSYSTRENPIVKCAVAAMRAGHSMFAVQNGGWCAASATAPQTYKKYGNSTACKADGKGGPWANQVYVFKGKLSFERDGRHWRTKFGNFKFCLILSMQKFERTLP